MGEPAREALVRDLLARTRSAREQIAKIAAERGLTYRASDIAQLVEDELPGDYPTLGAEGVEGRRCMLDKMARDMLAGERYENGA